MNTSIAAGAVVPSDDPLILKALQAASLLSGTLSRTPDQRWQVGIRNDAGVIYRTSILHSRNQLRRLALRMDRMGYVNELDDSAEERQPAAGFDAVFRRLSVPAPA